jgi:hypothetical protein
MAIKSTYLDEVFPICIDGEGYRINLAGMDKLCPTGFWGYVPFQKTYKTYDEANKVRKELWKTIVKWVKKYK